MVGMDGGHIVYTKWCFGRWESLTGLLFGVDLVPGYVLHWCEGGVLVVCISRVFGSVS